MHTSRRDPNHERHEEHCFDYLRQGLMCAADTTIEHPQVEHDGRRRFTDGWGVIHQCKDWSTIFDFVTANKGSNMTGILNPPNILDVPGFLPKL